MSLPANEPSADYAEPNGPALAAYARRHLALIASEDLSTERRLVAEKIIHLSFDAGRSVARLPDQLRLAIVTGLHKSDVSRAVAALIQAGMLERWQAHGETVYRILPYAKGWSVRWRQPDARARQLALDTEAWLFSLNQATPQEQDLPLPPELPSFEDAFAEVSRESALAAEPRGQHLASGVTSLHPSHPSDRARLDAGVPDIKARPCRQPTIRKPAAGVREVDAPAAASTRPASAAAGLPGAPTHPSDAPGLLGAPASSDAPTLVAAAPVSPPTATAIKPLDFAALPAHLRQPGAMVPVGYLANSASAEAAQPPSVSWLPGQLERPADSSSWLPGQLDSPESSAQLATWPTPRERAPTPARATDVSKHLEHPSSLKPQLPSGEHPDAADGCCRHEEDPDGAVRPDAEEWTGEIQADLRQAMGEAGWAQYRGAWQAYLAADRLTVVAVLGDYRLAVAQPNRRRPPIHNPGAWMRQRFLATSQRWKERRRAHPSIPGVGNAGSPHHPQPCPRKGDTYHA